jgi:hypothetical protein
VNAFISRKYWLLGLLWLMLMLATGCQPNAYLQSRDQLGRIGGYQGNLLEQMRQFRRLSIKLKAGEDYLCQAFQGAIDSRKLEANTLLGISLFILLFFVALMAWSIATWHKSPLHPVLVVVLVLVSGSTMAYSLQAWLPQGQIIAVAQQEHDQACQRR